MIEVRSNGLSAGRLSRLGERGSSFVYDDLKNPEKAVSLTMPLQPQSWDWNYGLLPIFAMNLPEGALRARLQNRFSKALGHVDTMDMLIITGRHQIGRLEYSGARGEGGPIETLTAKQEPPEGGFQSVDEILKARRDGELFDFLMERYAGQSGISGVQPKVLIRDVSKFSPAQKYSNEVAGGRASVSLSSATHIVKLWEADEYPELAANEYFCLQAAQGAGLSVPKLNLSESGEALVIERFDLDVVPNDLQEQGRGHYKGFEDFCVLNGINAEDKYRGSYESKLFRRITDYISPATAHEDLQALFKLFVLNVILRNGDAHLKNFGLIYDGLTGPVRLAPVYDVVTTTAYIPKDSMALTLAGSTRWPDRLKLKRLGISLCELSPGDVSQIIDETTQAVAQTRKDMSDYFKDSRTPTIGDAILKAWEQGLKEVS